jgi:predicted dehydrogenase
MAGYCIGMIGLTHPHSAGHLRTLSVTPEVERVLLYDPSPAAHAAARAHCPKATESFTELDELLARRDVAAVVIAVPTDQAPALVARAAAAGKHVLCEKPVGRTAAELAPALAALAAHQRRCCVFYTWRRHPVILKLRDLVRAGALGRLTSVELRMVTTQVGLRDPSHWLFKRSVAGGGIISWLGCHWLDAARFITGQEYDAVAALTATLSGEPIDVEDVAAVSFRLSGGALGTLHAGYLIAQGRAGYEGATYDNRVIVRGTLGRAEYLWAPAGEQAVELHSAAPGWNTVSRHRFSYLLADSPAYGGAHGLEFVREFLHTLEAGGPSPASAVDALRVVEALDAIYAAAAGGRTTPVERRDYAGLPGA